MTGNVSAIFDEVNDAQAAVEWLRSQGVPDEAISVVTPRAEELYQPYGDTGVHPEHADPEGETRDTASDTLAGAGIGAGAGALFGLAAAAIPGVGPFIAAGALGATLSGAAAGAVVGGVTGGVTSALADWGIDEEQARRFAGEVERGNTFVGVNLDRTTLSAPALRDAFSTFHGRFIS
ncbi:MAG: hypothetical protein KY468_05775 [Armatimonadetes bacterium]|nr:hypothetical protein [Armatimonadota bacterium]